MEDEVGAGQVERRPQRGRIPHVADPVVDGLLDAGGVEEHRIGIGRERVAVDVGAQVAQPQRQPAPLEPGVAGEEDPLAGVGAGEVLAGGCGHHQVFQGAFPLAHRSFSSVYSRSVSMGCQKPVCRKASSCEAAASRCMGSRSSRVAGLVPT